MTGELLLMSIAGVNKEKKVWSSSAISFSKMDLAYCLVDEKPLHQRFLVTAAVEAVHQQQNT
jgi:hypothetical protein